MVTAVLSVGERKKTWGFTAPFMGVKTITKHLNEADIRTRDGGRWSIGGRPQGADTRWRIGAEAEPAKTCDSLRNAVIPIIATSAALTCAQTDRRHAALLMVARERPLSAAKVTSTAALCYVRNTSFAGVPLVTTVRAVLPN